MAITYQLGSKLYINLTNRCTNDCKFCVRQFKDGLAGYKLWLEEEPTVEEVIEDIEDPTNYQEIVFCGFGEPLIRLDAVIEISTWLKENYPEVIVRINTNGLANLIHQQNVLLELEGLIDVISISLNASDTETYQEVSRSTFGEKSFIVVIDFIKEAKKYIPEVKVSVVDYEGVDIEACKDLAKELGVEIKVRHF